MIRFVNSRLIYGLGTLFTILAMAYALYLEHVKGLDPCPLCIFQRLCVIAMGVTLLIAFIHNSKGIMERIYTGLCTLAAIGGIIVAGRHSWLQHLPADEVPACGPGLEYLIDAFPLADMFRLVFTGSGECASIDWEFLGLTLPESTLLFFVGYAIVFSALSLYPWSRIELRLHKSH
ncbi:MAG: disulfide bond formation protein B [Gammaproteobacteria bacterium]|nr:MAG: disulfide bond formation protein B [Gammaproteobacteria bacterium]